MKRWFFCMLFVALSGRSWAQVVTEMTPDRIAEAISSGSGAKKLEYPRLKGGPAECAIITPFSRVARAAFDAKRVYKTLAPEDISPEMLAGTIDVACPSRCVTAGCTSAFGVATVQAIVITEKGGSNPQQPISSRPIPEEYQNAFGATDKASGLIATFPASVLQPGRELHVIFDRKISGMMSRCVDCKIDLKLEKVR